MILNVISTIQKFPAFTSFLIKNLILSLSPISRQLPSDGLNLYQKKRMAVSVRIQLSAFSVQMSVVFIFLVLPSSEPASEIPPAAFLNLFSYGYTPCLNNKPYPIILIYHRSRRPLLPAIHWSHPSREPLLPDG